MEPALSSYERRIQEANPLYAETTGEGCKLTQQEAAFIHYFMISGNATQAFLKAGFTYPRRPTTKEERILGVADTTRTQTLSTLFEETGINSGTADKRKREVDVILNKHNTIEEESTIEENKIEEYPIEEESTSDPQNEHEYLLAVGKSAHDLLFRPEIKGEIARRRKLMDDAQVADVQEIYAYFTAVMRGQVLDQFGLEAPLSERTRAAECLAKRLIDIPKKLEVSGSMGSQSVNLIIQPFEEKVFDTDFTE